MQKNRDYARCGNGLSGMHQVNTCFMFCLCVTCLRENLHVFSDAGVGERPVNLNAEEAREWVIMFNETSKCADLYLVDITPIM